MGVDGQNAVNAACAQEIRVGGDELLFVPVVDGEVEIAFTDEQIANAAENLGVITLAKFGQKDADGAHTFTLQGARDHAGLVVEFGGCCFDAGAGGLWNGTAWGVVENERDSGRAQAEVFRQHFEVGMATGL